MKRKLGSCRGFGAALWLAIPLFAPVPARADAYFTEDFSSGAQSADLEPFSPYFQVIDGKLHRTAPQEFADRRYLRTALSDYNQRDFVFEVTFTSRDDIIWFGMGTADRNSAYHEPQQSVVFWVRPTSIEGWVGANTIFGSVPFDRVYSDGPHRVRITKIGRRIGFELDERFNGVFDTDISTSFMDYSEVMPSLNASTSFLFFGSYGADNYFDDLVIGDPGAPLPDCNSNGAPDAADIAGGTSQDAGGDGVPDECQDVETYFADDFEGTAANPSLEGYGAFFSVEGGVIRRTGMMAYDDRRYLRTAQTDYNVRDFVFEVSFTTQTDIAFIGIGEAGLGAAYNEPKNSVTFRCHPPSVAEGYIGIASAQGEVSIGKLTTVGPHRARIEKKGAKVTFSIDEAHDGTFEADMSRSFSNLAVLGPFLNDRNSHLFFGNGSRTESFDELSITESLVSGPDCNLNGVADADDIQRGTSTDANADLVPDECQTMQGSIALASQPGTGLVRVVVTNDVPIRGGEIGIAYDPAALLAIEVRRGADLPAVAEIHSSLSPAISCPGSPAVTAGITVGWLTSSDGTTLTPAGTHELLEIVLEPSLTQLADGCFPLRFVGCLGVPAAPVSNILTGADGKSLLVGLADGEVCVSGRPAFRRGDANGDGRFDISDPITILTCLFLGPDCPACIVASDANDDGLVNIADPTYLLGWRFLTGSEPPPPFPGCGADSTFDALATCDGFPGCP